MEIIKLFFQLFEQELFAFIGATSWIDLLQCLLSYSFVLFVLGITLFLPLSLFFLMFLSPFIF